MRLARRRGLPILRLGPALLAIPPFRAGLPRLSEQILAEHRPDGTMAPGSVARAFPSATPDQAAAGLADRLVRQRTGGSYWATAASSTLLAGAGSGLAIVAAGGPVATARALAAAFARVGAGRTVLVGDGADPATRRLAARAGCRIALGALDPWPLFDAAAELHAAGDTILAVLAVLAGVPVHCHSPVWFAGRGLTNDAAGIPTLRPSGYDQFAAACLLDGVRYRDPFNGEVCTADHALDLAAEWRRVCDANRSVAACVGMQIWKRRRMRQFLHDGVRPPPFFRSAAPAVAAAQREGGAVAGWASRLPPALAAQAAAACVPVIRVEDGFLRSVGLGSDFMPPCSVVLDGSGLYYDPAQPSDLETVLATAPFDARLLARAAAAIDRVTQAGLTKYNTGSIALPAMPAGRRSILVPGQVADDLSVRLGGGVATGNADLLRRVRADNPDAFIIYRPHPDVDAGHRPGAIPDADALRSADLVSRGVPMGALIGAVDALHTMTSLAGFEALLRGREVVAWGRPFYAGWGLTADHAPIPRRTRRLTVEQLAAGVLLLYPRYLDPVTRLPCPAETLIGRLATPELWRPGLLVRLRRWQGRLAPTRTAA